MRTQGFAKHFSTDISKSSGFSQDTFAVFCSLPAVVGD